MALPDLNSVRRMQDSLLTASLAHEAQLRARYPNLFNLPPERTTPMNTSVTITRGRHGAYIVRVESGSGVEKRYTQVEANPMFTNWSLEHVIEDTVRRHHQDIAHRAIDAWKTGR